MIKSICDIVVVGAGPAGSRAARSAALKGVSVLLVEKDRDIGLPVRCAEGVYKNELTKLVEIDDRWISQEVTGSGLVAPNGHSVQAADEETGYILNRKVFDFDLAVMASEAGAKVLTETFVHGMNREKDGTFRVFATRKGEEIEILSKIVIGADGIESRVGRWAGIDTSLELSGVESCYQYTMTNIKINPDIVQFYISREFAPGGYAWVFPKGRGMANVGLGILGTYAKRVNPEKSLIKFTERYFPNGSVVSQTAGGVPVLPGLKRMVADGVILAGDAARQVNPLSGGGIINGMLAGDLAAEHAVRALAEGDVSESNLKDYQKDWDKLKGRENRRLYKLQRAINSIDDDVFNDLVDKMSELPVEKRTVFAFFKKVLFNHPGLIVDVAKLFLK